MDIRFCRQVFGGFLVLTVRTLTSNIRERRELLSQPLYNRPAAHPEQKTQILAEIQDRIKLRDFDEFVRDALGELG